jgi:hypothetical protein
MNDHCTFLLITLTNVTHWLIIKCLYIYSQVEQTNYVINGQYMVNGRFSLVGEKIKHP